MDATAFATTFSDMFGKYSEQLKQQNEALLDKIDELGEGLAGILAPEKPNEAKPNTNPLAGIAPDAKPPAPRQVKKAATKVYIEDISKKASKMLSQDGEAGEDGEDGPPKGKNGALWLLGGVLGTAAAGVIGSVMGAGGSAGAVTGQLVKKVMGVLFKPLKPILKRLPLIGSLISFFEAYEHFQKGTVDSIILGILDIAAGISYALPGVGTAIGIGIDVLSYFLENKVEEFQKENADASFFGTMYDKVIEYLSETDQIKWMVELGEKFGILWDDPTDLDNWTDFLTHVGKIGFGLIDMLSSFDKTVGTALGITDDKGEGMGLVAKMTELVNTYVVDPIFSLVEEAFNMVKKAIEDASNFVMDKVRSAGQYFGMDSPEEARAAREAEAAAEQQSKKEDRDRVLKRHLIMRLGDPGSNEELKGLYDEIMADDERKAKLFKAIDERKENFKGSGLPAYVERPLEDFAVINGELVDLPSSAIINRGKVQSFSGDDTVIGFKEGEALINGINQLISVGQEQLKTLTSYLDKPNNNIVAPSTTNNVSNNFEIESSVSTFRKAVT